VLMRVVYNPRFQPCPGLCGSLVEYIVDRYIGVRYSLPV
jgi:hypothetical protein